MDKSPDAENKPPLGHVKHVAHPRRQFLDGEGLGDQVHAGVEPAVVEDGVRFT